MKHYFSQVKEFAGKSQEGNVLPKWGQKVIGFIFPVKQQHCGLFKSRE